MAEATLYYSAKSEIQRFAARVVAGRLGKRGIAIDTIPLPSLPPLSCLLSRSPVSLTHGDDVPATETAPSFPGSYRRTRSGTGSDTTVRIDGFDENGVMYALFDLADTLRSADDLAGLDDRSVSPHTAFRAVKINLPWSSYRRGEVMSVHEETSRSRDFWARFIDTMAENRFNAITIWNLHPFPYLFKPRNFPEAAILTDAEQEEWRDFWRFLFRHAKGRGVETWIVDWNIFVSPEFARVHGVDLSDREYHIGKADTREIVKRYNRECITQLIDEYEDLTGFGVSIGERMENLSSEEREAWIEEVVIGGIKAAKRPVKFMHRAPFTADPQLLRDALDRAGLATPPIVEYKFNWSHGHSSPRLCMTHDVSGRTSKPKVDDRYWSPVPASYRMVWMIRNEDFFILRWGEPGFIREHVRTNLHDWVAGYIVGSEGSIPAKDYSHRLPHGHVSWRYAFEKQWLFYTLWGTLLFDPDTRDEVLSLRFEERYGEGTGASMLRAFTLASRMPLRLASFHGATWDYTLYSEGFIAPFPSLGLHDGKSPFISIDELIDHRTLDPRYIAIPEFLDALDRGDGFPADAVTPDALAAMSETDADEVLALVGRLGNHAPVDPAYRCELDDLSTWAYLEKYFAWKIRAALALARYRRNRGEEDKAGAREHIGKAISCWEKVVEITDAHYREVPYIERKEENYALTFSWKKFLDAAREDARIIEGA